MTTRVRMPSQADLPGVTAMISWLQLLCLGWITWLPVSQGRILYPALGAVLATSVALIVLRRLSVPPEVRWMAALYYALVAVLALSAFARGNEGAAHQTALWAGVPLIWGSWAITLRGEHLRRTMWTLVVSAGVTSALLVYQGLAALGVPNVLPASFLDLQKMWFTVAASSQIEMHYLGLSSLVGLAVLVIALASLPGSMGLLPPLWLIRIVAVLAFLAAVVSGRRGLTIVAVLAPLLAVSWALLLLARRRWEEEPPPKSYWRDAATGAAAVVLVALSPFGANLTAFVGFNSGFVDWEPVLTELRALGADDGSSGVGGADDGSSGVGGADDGSSGVGGTKPPTGGEVLDEGDGAVRADQVSELIGQWRQHPIVGSGLGAELDSGYERDPARPWMFENQSLQILMNIGLAGFAALAVVGWFMLRLLRRAWAVGTHHRMIAASTIMMFLVLLANTTNPYLAAPGHGWAVFLCVGLCVASLSQPAQSQDTLSPVDHSTDQQRQ